jgi:hypothetical protein
MKGLIGLAVVTALAAAATTASGSPNSRVVACKAGVKTIGGVIYRTFCGPATATVSMRGKQYSFSGGKCTKTGVVQVFTVSVGTLTVGKNKPRFKYFGAAVSAASHDGVYRRGVVGWAVNRKRYSLYNVRLSLSGSLTRGTFSGRIVGGGRATGSFRCK